MTLLGWAIVASGLSALYFWQKLHPDESINPMPPPPPNKTSMKP